MIMSTTANIFNLIDYFKYKGKCVDTDQSALGPHCLSKRLYKYFSRLLVLCLALKCLNTVYSIYF